VGDSLNRLFGVLEGLAAALARLAAARGGPPRRDDLAALRPAIFQALTGHRDLAIGAGVITAPDVLADAPLWLEWWWTKPAGTPEQLRVNLDPAAPDFYDYTTAAWYTSAKRSGRPEATGPYVDYFCTGEYTFTLSVPVLLDGRFLGVAAADVLAESLEKLVMPGLLTREGPVALASQDDRLVAATSARLPPDLRVPAGSTVLPSPLLRWRLAQLQSTEPWRPG
jgi:hypothetical protein